MKLSREQRQAISRLREHEGLTGNLIDAPASAVLKWAEEQIKSNVPEDLVVSAVRTVNQRGVESADEAVAIAADTLEQQSTVAPIAATEQVDQPLTVASTDGAIDPGVAEFLKSTSIPGNVTTETAENKSPESKKRRKSRKRKTYHEP